MKNPIYSCLWFDGQAKAAAEFYCSVFKNSKIIADTALVVTFEINGTKFMGLNGGPHSNLTKQFHLWLTVTHRKKLIITGKNSLMVDKKASMAGLKINLAYHGKLYPQYLPN